MTENQPAAGRNEEAVDELIAEFLRRTDAGETLASEEFVSQHTEYSEELQRYFQNVELLQHLSETETPQGAETLFSPEASEPPAAEEASSETVLRGTADSETSMTRQVDTTPKTEASIPEKFGRYKIKKSLGQGAMGAVYLALDTQLDRDVALKIPKFGDLNEVDEEEMLARFYREARAAATLRSPNICPVYDVGEIEGQHYITMAFIEGRPLKDFTKSKKRHSETQIVTTIRKLALGLAEAHEIGVIHRDLKPANIMVDKKGEPVVMDFGLARRSSSDDVQVTQSGAILGTPAYMSPEQVEGDQSLIGPQCDIYALGIIMYELITGEMPFKGNLMKILQQIALNNPTNPSKLRKDIDPRLEKICMKMMAGDMSKRYATMNDVAADLQECIRHPRQKKTEKQKGKQSAKLDPKRTSLPSRSEETSPALISIEQPKSYAEQLREKKGKSSSKAKSKKPILKPSKSKSKQSGGKSSSLPPRKMLIAGGIGGLLLLFGIVFLVRIGKYDVEITLEDPTITLSVDGEVLNIKDGKDVYKLSAGKHKLHLEQGRLKTDVEEFTVEKDGKTAIIVRLVDKKAVITKSGEKLPVIKPKTSHQMASDELEPDRSTAQFVLENGGVVAVRTDAGRILRLLDSEKLPEVPFALIYIAMYPSGDLNLRDEHVRGLTELTWFAVRSDEITDTGMAHLAKNPNLNYVLLDHAQVTEAGIALLEGLPLDGLRLINCRSISATALKSIGRMAGLTNLAIMGASHITDADIAPLKALSKLLKLELRETQITAPVIQNLHQALSGCKIISDFGTFGPSDSSGGIDSALSFDGVDDYVQIPMSDVEISGSMTIDFWANVPSENTQAENEQTSILNWVTESHMIEVRVGDGPQGRLKAFVREADKNLVAGFSENWQGLHHYAMVWDQTTLNLYQDGQLVGSQDRFDNTPLKLNGLKKNLLLGTGTPIEEFLGNTQMHTFNGEFLQLRISRTALFTENFDPPSLLEADGNTLALYKFDDGQGEVLRDSSGSGHDGKIIGAKWTSASSALSEKSGSALKFDGLDDFVIAEDFKVGPDEPFTMELWVKNDGIPTEAEWNGLSRDVPEAQRTQSKLVSIGSVSADQDQAKSDMFDLKSGAGAGTGGGNWTGQIIGPKKIPRSGDWFHIAVQWDGEQVDFFVNGIPEPASKRKFLRLSTPAERLIFYRDNWNQVFPLVIGGLSKSSSTDDLLFPFRGSVREFRFSSGLKYSDTFTPDARFNKEADTKVLYHFDGGSGDVLHDSSGNGHDGKIVGAKWVQADTLVTTRPSGGSQRGGLRFSGNQKAEIPGDVLSYDGSHPLTVEGWIDLSGTFPESSSDGTIYLMGFGKYLGLQAVNFGDATENRLCWHCYGGNARDSKFEPGTMAVLIDQTKSGPTHVAMVYSGTEISLYIDGNLIEGPFPFEFDDKQEFPSSFHIGTQWQHDQPLPDHLDFAATFNEVRISKNVRYSKNFTPQHRFESDSETMALYHLDEGVGDTLKDSSGNRHDGKIGGAKWVADALPGIQSFNLRFDGEQDHGAIYGGLFSHHLPEQKLNQFTLEGVFLIPTSADQNERSFLMAMGSPYEGGKKMTGILHDKGRIGIARPDDVHQLSDAKLPVGRPFTVAYVFDGSEAALYLDGKLIYRGEDQAKNPTNFLTLGSYGYQGWMKNIRFSSVARYTGDYLPQMIHEVDENTIALYHLDEGTGNILKDSSGNGHHVEIRGAKWVGGDEAAGQTWRPLFDGKTLDGWEQFGGQENDWKVGNGLITSAESGKASRLVYTQEEFRNVDVRMDCRLTPQGNSGLYVRAKKSAGLNGYEAQLAFPDSPSNGGSFIGDLFKHSKGAKTSVRPGEWFTLELHCRGNTLRVFINGIETAYHTDTSDQFPSGHIALQAMRGRIHVRSIEVRTPIIETSKTTTPDSPNYALRFQNQEVDSRDDSFVYDGSHPLTVECWIDTSGISAEDVGKRTAMLLGASKFMALQIEPLGGGEKTLHWHLYAGNGQEVNGHNPYRAAELDLTRKTPTHVAMVYDGESVALYLDGKQVPHRRDGKRVVEPFLYKFTPENIKRNALYIGAKWSGEKNSDSVKSHVTFDEVRVSKIARYSKDFTPQKRFESDKQTIALYHFDEGAGEVFKDASGNGYDRKTNGAKWVKVDNELQVMDSPQTAPIDPHRQVVELVLRRGGSVMVETTFGQRVITEIEQLPQRFALSHLNLDNCQQWSDEDWQVLEEVKYLDILFHRNKPVSETGFNSLKNVRVVFDLKLRNSKFTDAGVKTTADFIGLTRLGIRDNPDVTAASCPALLNLTELRELDIRNTGITGVGLKTLSALPKLHTLTIDLSHGITASDIAELDSLKSLQTLNLHGENVDDDVIMNVAKLKSLRTIFLNETSVSDEGADRLQQLLPDCSVIHPSLPTHAADQKAAQWAVENGRSFYTLTSPAPLHEIPKVPFVLKTIWGSEDGKHSTSLANLTGLRSLEALHLPNLEIADVEIASLEKMTSLRTLYLPISDVSAAGIERLNNLAQLENLNLDRCRKVSDDALSHLVGFQHLHTLGLNDTSISDKGLIHLGKLPSLRYLALGYCRNISGSGLEHLLPLKHLRRLNLGNSTVTDVAIPHLQRMHNLRILIIYGTKITAAGAEKLQAALPGCVVFHESLEEIPWKSVANNRPSKSIETEREIAEWLISEKEMSVSVVDAAGQVHRAVKELPIGTVVVTHVEWAQRNRTHRDSGHFTSTELSRLADLKQLRGLSLNQERTTLEQLEKLMSLSSLEELALETHRPSNLTDAEMALLIAKLPKLVQLNLGNFQLTGECLQAIVNPERLEKFRLTQSPSALKNPDQSPQVSAETLRGFGRFSNLKHLHLSGPTHTREHYQAIASLTSITRLDLNYDQGVAQGLADLQTMPQLQMLSLTATPLDDSHVDELIKFTNIRGFFLRQTKLTEEGVQRLHKALPKCTLQSDFGIFVPAAGDTQEK